MNGLLFFDSLDGFLENNVFLAKMAGGIQTKNDLLNELKSKLCLPEYFGCNWDALDECLNDLHWIHEKNIVIFHQKLPMLPEDDLSIYLSILKDAVDQFGETEFKNLRIVFPTESKKFIDALIRKLP